MTTPKGNNFIRKITTAISSYKLIDEVVNFKMKKSGLTFQSVELGNYSINYWDSKTDKPVILLLPAFAAESKYTWFKQVNQLKHHFRIVIPNLVYFGGSTAKSKKYTIAEQVEALELLIDRLKIESLSICGASYGGFLAFEFAINNSSKIQKIAIVNSPIRYVLKNHEQEIYAQFGVNGKAELLIPSDYRTLKKLFSLSHFKPPFLPTVFFKSIHKHLYQTNMEHQRMVIRKFEEERTLMRNKDYPFTFPILLIWGKEDKITPVQIGKELQSYFGENGTFTAIPKTAHVPHLEKPKVFNQILVSFLRA